MLKTGFGSFYSDVKQLDRPKTSITRLTHSKGFSEIPLHRRIRRAYHMETIVYDTRSYKQLKSVQQSKVKIDSDQPETVYSWLDEFQTSIVHKSVGTSFEYPAAKYEQSSKLVSSKGYRAVKQMQKLQKVPYFAQQMRKELRKIQQRRLQVTEESPSRKTIN